MAGEGNRTDSMKREKTDYTIQSVSHALDILESFTRTEDELGVTELAQRLGLHKNNVFRLLATLEHRGYIEQNRATESYRLGPRTLQIGLIFVAQRECRRLARPIIEALQQETGETAFVAVLRGDQVICMDSVESERTVRTVSRVGVMQPAHCTAVGKVQLAALLPEELDRLFPGPELPGLTDRSITTRNALQAALLETAAQGYALEDEEAEADVRGIAAAARDFSGNVVAAVGITAPVSRLTDSKLSRDGVIDRVRDAAHRLSTKLGLTAHAAAQAPLAASEKH